MTALRTEALDQGPTRSAVFMSETQALIVEQVPIDLLKPDPKNPRRADDATLDALERNIREHGILQPIVARRDDGMIIGGHQRVVVARRLGLETVPVIWLDLPIERSRLLNLAFNKIQGGWDHSLLPRMLIELSSAPGIDLSLTGLADDEVKGLLRRLEVRQKRAQVEDCDLDDALNAATREPRTKPGDLWILGEHRLLCGDATKADDVDRLLAGHRASMVLIDPPYNVDLGNHGGQARGAKKRPMANDALEPAAEEAFVRSWAKNLLAVTDGAIYCFTGSRELPLVSRIFAEEGGHWSDFLIWKKDRFTLGRADYQHAYEPIWYGWREGSGHYWRGDRDQSDVWEIPRPAASPLHSVMKPTALLERAITNSSRDGDLVLDA